MPVSPPDNDGARAAARLNALAPALLGELPFGILVADGDGAMHAWNAAARRLLGDDGREDLEVRKADRVARAAALDEHVRSKRDRDEDDRDEHEGPLEPHPTPVHTMCTCTSTGIERGSPCRCAVTNTLPRADDLKTATPFTCLSVG